VTKEEESNGRERKESTRGHANDQQIIRHRRRVVEVNRVLVKMRKDHRSRKESELQEVEISISLEAATHQLGMAGDF